MKLGWAAAICVLFALALSFRACGADLAGAVDGFKLSPPATAQGGSALLRRGTARMVRISRYFSMELIPDEDAAIALLDAAGRALGPRLGEVQFCDAAMGGAVIIASATYYVVGAGRERQANCKRVFSRYARRHPVSADALGRARFARSHARFGLGVHGLRLVPGRTLATDPGYIATGTALYVPSLRGRRMDGGVLHDGYVFAADVGEGIRGDLVAWFAGLGSGAAPANSQSSQSWSVASGPVEAHIVTDPSIVAALEHAHRLP